MDRPDARSRLRFGPFEFEPIDGELHRDGQRVRLQEQPRQLLAALLERPGEVVTREALRERLWRADTFVDFEHSLNTAVRKVRQALGDPAGTPQYIETVAKRGYRFVAPVAPASTSPAAPTSASAPTSTFASAPATVVRSHATGVWVVAITLLAVAGGTAWWASNGRGREAGSPSPAELAVLPLRVLSNPAGAGDVSYLGVGIADAITTRLASVRQIAVRPTWALLPYRDALQEPAALASAIGVDQLLVGTVQPADGRYRVSVQLVQASGVVIWARSYDEAATSLLELQDRIATEIVTALRVRLSPPERARLHARYTVNPAADHFYLRGRALLVAYTESNMREAIGQFEQAIAIDRHYALARAALATACAWFSVRYVYEAEAKTWGERADDEARRALEEDPALADAHLAIASAAGTLFGGFDWVVVLDRSATALTLDPSLDLAHVVRMRAFYHLGRFDEVRREAELAQAVNPTPNVEASRLEVAANLFGGRFSEAAEQATGLLAETDAPAIRHYLGMARYYLGDAEGARDMLASARRGGQPDVRSQATLASIEAATGLKREARERARTIIAGSYMDHHVAYSLGATFAQLGDTAESVRWLAQAADTGFPCYPWFALDSLLAPIRTQPEFTRVLERLQAAQTR